MCNPFSTNPNIAPLRFTRVVFGVLSNPFILSATLCHHVDCYFLSDPEFVYKLLRSLYINDYASSCENIPKVLELARKIKLTFLIGFFNMRKWQTSSLELLQAFRDDPELTEELFRTVVIQSLFLVIRMMLTTRSLVRRGMYKTTSLKWTLLRT